MYLKRLTVRGVGRVDQLDLDLKGGISLIQSGFVNEIVLAVGAVTANRPITEVYPPVRTGRTSLVSAEIRVGGKTFSVTASGRDLTVTAETAEHSEYYDSDTDEYLSLMHRCEVEDRLCLIDEKRRSPYHDLNLLLDEEKLFGKGELRRVTGGTGVTCSFRTALRYYLLAETIANEDKRDLLSRLDAVRFWDRFGRTRDMHYEPKPLLLVNLTDGKKRMLDPDDLPGRQIVVFSPLRTENGTYKAV